MYHPVVKQITDILTERGFWFESFEHEPVRTSEQAAKVRAGYTIEQGAKALIIRIKKRELGITNDGNQKFVMLVIPGNLRLDNKKVKQLLKVREFTFATEDEVREVTKGVEPGGVPPLGNLFGLEVICDPAIFQNEKIIFNAGDKRFSVGMYSKDYQAVVNPRVEEIT